MLAELQQLSQERTSEGRVLLLRRVTDLFISAGTDKQSADEFLFTEIVDTLLNEIVGPDKVNVSEHYADGETTPRPLALRLAQDEDAAISSPMLSRSPVLREDDIVMIATSAGDAQLEAIAKRNGLSESITDVLVERGSNSVLHTVSDNQSASFSRQGMNLLVSRASGDTALCMKLVARADLTQATVDQMKDLLDESLAAGLAARGFEIDSVLSPTILADAKSKYDKLVRAHLRGARNCDTLIDEIDKGRMSTDDAVTASLNERRFLDVARIVGHVVGLEHSFVLSTLLRGDAETVALLLRATSIGYPVFCEILKQRNAKQPPGTRPLKMSETEYTSFDQNTIDRTLRFLKVRLTASKKTH